MRIKRVLFLIAGCICLGIGSIGIVLPVIPTVPFYLATLFCFANSSQRLHDWFKGTKMYKDHLESYVQKRGMTANTKLKILVSVTFIMSIGFVMMLIKGIYVPCIILAAVWICHLIYFIFGVRTIAA